MLDEAVEKAGLRAGANLILFRKMLHTLEGVLADIGADGDRGEHRVPDHWAGRSRHEPRALKGGGGGPQCQVVGERHVPVERCVVDAGDGDRDIRVVVRGGLGKAGGDIGVLDPDAWNGEVLVAVYKRRLAIQPSQLFGGDPERLRQLMCLRLLNPRRRDAIYRQPIFRALSHDFPQYSLHDRRTAIDTAPGHVSDAVPFPIVGPPDRIEALPSPASAQKACGPDCNALVRGRCWISAALVNERWTWRAA